MRRRKVWAIFLAVAFVFGAGTLMFLAGLMKAFSFGMVDGSEIEHDLAVLVVWPAFGLAAVAYAIGAWRRRTRQMPHRETFGEIAALALAIFFGGLLSLSRVSGLAWDRPIVAALFLGYALADAGTPQSSMRRRIARAAAMLLVGLGTTWIIRYAAY